jgi:hypothetical protein
MVIAGTKHFKANLEQTGNQDSAQAIYQALRLYNSGSMNANVSDSCLDIEIEFLTPWTESL